MKQLLPFLIVFLGFQAFTLADEAPRVGRGAAAKYFEKRSPDSQEAEETTAPATSSTSGTDSEHFLALHFGKMMSSTAYEWGTESKQSDVGDFTAGLT